MKHRAPRLHTCVCRVVMLAVNSTTRPRAICKGHRAHAARASRASCKADPATFTPTNCHADDTHENGQKAMCNVLAHHRHRHRRHSCIRDSSCSTTRTPHHLETDGICNWRTKFRYIRQCLRCPSARPRSNTSVTYPAKFTLVAGGNDARKVMLCARLT